MQVLKAILVDDELNSLQNLQFKIQEYCPSIKGRCPNSKSGRSHPPDSAT